MRGLPELHGRAFIMKGCLSPYGTLSAREGRWCRCGGYMYLMAGLTVSRRGLAAAGGISWPREASGKA